MAWTVNRDKIEYRDGDVYINGKLYGSEAEFDSKLDSDAIRMGEPAKKHEPEMADVYNEEDLRKYVREVLVQKFGEETEILPVEVKNQIKQNASSIRASLVAVMKDLETENFAALANINKAIAKLNQWKSHVEKILN